MIEATTEFCLKSFGLKLPICFVGDSVREGLLVILFVFIDEDCSSEITCSIGTIDFRELNYCGFVDRSPRGSLEAICFMPTFAFFLFSVIYIAWLYVMSIFMRSS